jgi:hypothetical protein
LGDIHLLGHPADVDEVVGHPGELGLCRFRRANIGPPVEQQRVAGHDFRVIRLRPTKRQLGFADGSATSEDVKAA